MGELLVGTTLLASFLGGMVALLAPCCVSVMLPAYLATGFAHRRGVVAATLVFGAGVATLILPIGLGATALSRLLFGGHLWVFSIGGVLMIVGGIAVLARVAPESADARRAGGPRRQLPLGLPARGVRRGGIGVLRAGAGRGRCAVGAAASFPVALAVGVAYVAGMVTPLAVIALIWDAGREKPTRVLTDKTVVLRWSAHRRTVALGTGISGALMIAMGLLAIVLAVTGRGMPSGGWQSELSGWLQHLSASTLHAVSWPPGWAVIAILAVVFTILIRYAMRPRSRPPTESEPVVITETAQAREDLP